jgi:lipoprotein-releasing system ATP-binding protein
MIQLEDLHKSYGQTKVLKGITANIAPGDFITIKGASGAGKSTLLHLIAGLDQPDRGQILFEGKSLNKLPKKGLNKWRNEEVGLVFQFHNLLPELTALENVQIPRWIGGNDKSEAEKAALELIAKLGIQGRGNHYPNELSGGEQQRVAIARALVNNPALLLADEPTGNLDSANADAVHELLVRLNQDFGQTLIVVTHNEKLAALGTKQWTMADGTLIE